MDPREFPLAASWSVRRARDAYLEENGFTVASYDDTWTSGSFLGIEVKIPNTKKHRWAIRLHDLHHVATGYGTDPIGEGELSVWEMRRGLRPLGLYVASIVVFGAIFGFVLAPRRMLAAWRAAGDASLYDLDPPYDDLLDFEVRDLRAMLGVPACGIATRARRLHDRAPVTVAP